MAGLYMSAEDSLQHAMYHAAADKRSPVPGIICLPESLAVQGIQPVLWPAAARRCELGAGRQPLSRKRCSGYLSLRSKSSTPAPVAHSAASVSCLAPLMPAPARVSGQQMPHHCGHEIRASDICACWLGSQLAGALMCRVRGPRSPAGPHNRSVWPGDFQGHSSSGQGEGPGLWSSSDAWKSQRHHTVS